MTIEEQQKLSDLEGQMRLLIQIRNGTVRAAELAISRANVEFDRQALPLARKINTLREKLEDEIPPPSAPMRQREHKPVRSSSVDPEWSQEDIDHYQELVGR